MKNHVSAYLLQVPWYCQLPYNSARPGRILLHVPVLTIPLYGKEDMLSYVIFQDDNRIFPDKKRSLDTVLGRGLSLPKQTISIKTSFGNIVSKKVSDDNRENSEIKKSLKDFKTSIDLDREYEGISFGEAAGILGTVTEKLKHTKIDTVERCTIFGGSFNSNGSV